MEEVTLALRLSGYIVLPSAALILTSNGTDGLDYNNLRAPQSTRVVKGMKEFWCYPSHFQWGVYFRCGVGNV